jgi:hypothetical protein
MMSLATHRPILCHIDNMLQTCMWSIVVLVLVDSQKLLQKRNFFR